MQRPEDEHVPLPEHVPSAVHEIEHCKTRRREGIGHCKHQKWTKTCLGAIFSRRTLADVTGLLLGGGLANIVGFDGAAGTAAVSILGVEVVAGFATPRDFEAVAACGTHVATCAAAPDALEPSLNAARRRTPVLEKKGEIVLTPQNPKKPVEEASMTHPTDGVAIITTLSAAVSQTVAAERIEIQSGLESRHLSGDSRRDTGALDTCDGHAAKDDRGGDPKGLQTRAHPDANINRRRSRAEITAAESEGRGCLFCRVRGEHRRDDGGGVAGDRNATAKARGTGGKDGIQFRADSTCHSGRHR